MCPTTDIPNDWKELVMEIPLLQPQNISKSKNKKKGKNQIVFHFLIVYIKQKLTPLEVLSKNIHLQTKTV